MEKARNFIIRIFTNLQRPEMRILPGQLAFFIALTIIPILALIATVFAALSISTETIRIAISESIPKSIADILNSIIVGNGISFNIIVFYFSALLLASNGTYSMINVSNEIYKIEPKNILTRRLKAIVMIFIFVLILIFLFAVPLFGNTIAKIIINATGSTSVVLALDKLLSLLKYPIMIILIFFALKLVYVIAPDAEIPSRTTNQGALFTALGWVLSTEIFSFYLEKFATYDAFYGSISNILVLLLWIYLLSFIFVLGMIINASIYKEEVL